MIRVRTLGPGDEEVVEAFLRRHADSSMFLRSNLRAAGLVDRGAPFEATWAGAFDDDALVGVAAHAWNHNVLVQAPHALEAVVRHAVTASRRTVGGLLGAWPQVVAARAALGADAWPTRFVSHDDLFALDLDQLVVPAALARGDIVVRRARAADRSLIVRWRSAYRVELLGHPADDPEIDASSAAEIDPVLRQQDCFLLESGGQPVAFAMFNGRLPDCVQIGGVFTPPALRARGFARAVVAGALRIAHADGVTRSILFTGRDNAFARRAYLSLGYRIVGDYGIHFYEGTRPLAPSSNT
jgi:predicted GNAT family acetyltransferase